MSKTFDGFQALGNISAKIPSLGVTALIGPNGAGKTTLINVLTGFLQPDAGRCFVGGKDVTDLAAYEIARLGVARTFQDLRLAMAMSVLDNVLLARPHQAGERLTRALLRFGVKAEEARNRAEAMRLLHIADLGGMASELAGNLSYGQQKLLSLTCCLATEARILVLDEPIAGVHPSMVSQILDLLRQLRQSGKTILFIEHDISAVRLIADHIFVMDTGKIIAEGVPSDVLAKPEILEAYLA